MGEPLYETEHYQVWERPPGPARYRLFARHEQEKIADIEDLDDAIYLASLLNAIKRIKP
jgi:hypothetical protein